MRNAPHQIQQPAVDPALWPLDPSLDFLNHGSFGSCPRAVLEFQSRLRERMERQPVQFFARDLERELDQTRLALSAFLNADPEHLVPVPNATAGVNAVLRSLKFQPGDELLTTNQEYNACRNALEFVAQRDGAVVKEAAIPFPLDGEAKAATAVLKQLTPKTRLVLTDHVVSQTGIILPIENIVKECRQKGVETLIDGAHAPGMVEVDLKTLGATYYTGNCHKWMCAPKGAGFLCVHPDRQANIRPLAISHGANSPRTDRSRFQLEFAWTGTSDVTPWLSVPEALRYMESLLPGGWPQIRARNRSLALAARDVICRHLKISPPCPDSMIGSLASFPLSDSQNPDPPLSPLYSDPLQETLLGQHGLEAPVIPWPRPPKRLLRVSAQLYNALPQYEKLAKALLTLLKRS